MANDYFQFKRFIIFQGQCALKVGTDGVLLGLWAKGNTNAKILDIGCGSGLISLIMAQRFEKAQVTGVEIIESCATQAIENVNGSPFKDRVTIVNQRIQEFKGDLFDVIVCNPPYFENSLLSEKSEKDIARHTLTLSYSELLNCSRQLLSPTGVVNIVLPIEFVAGFINLAESQYSLFTTAKTTFQHKSTKAAKRAMIQLEKIKKPLKTEALILFDSNGNPTPEFLKLGADFYLNF